MHVYENNEKRKKEKREKDKIYLHTFLNAHIKYIYTFYV